MDHHARRIVQFEIARRRGVGVRKHPGALLFARHRIPVREARPMKQAWDAARYQSRHSYVFAYGESLIELLEPRAGERILDLGCGSGQLTAKIAETGAEVT